MPMTKSIGLYRFLLFRPAAMIWKCGLAVSQRNGRLVVLSMPTNLAPDRPDILVYRASAQRYLGALPQAMAGVEWALALQPDNPDGLLERGNLRRLQGDAAGARADWLRVLDLAAATPAGDAARANLEALDFKVE